jgi:hypothetical protein
VRRLVFFGVIGLMLLAQSFAPVPSAVAQTTPRLSSLVIDIWPEFDRLATVLVIYRGQFAANAPVPEHVTIRIPASAGEPSAVASPQAGSESMPINQWTELIAAKKVATALNGDWAEVTFSPPSRLFNLEFYDKLSTVTYDRRYEVTWPGDYAADAVTLNVREPTGTTNFQATPALPPGVIDEEGLVAHQLNPGALNAGQALAISLSYHREDKRTSVEALQLVTPVPTQPVTVTSPAATVSSQWPLIIALGVGLALIIGGLVWYVRSQRAETFHPYQPPKFGRAKGRRSVRTSRTPHSRPRPATAASVTLVSETSDDAPTYCTQCGKSLRPDDVFCPRCGTRVKGK